MPQGPGTYGSAVGRPPKKEKSPAKSGVVPYTPFKMKVNPMKRNFGIGASPAKREGVVDPDVAQARATTERTPGAVIMKTGSPAKSNGVASRQPTRTVSNSPKGRIMARKLGSPAKCHRDKAHAKPSQGRGGRTKPIRGGDDYSGK